MSSTRPPRLAAWMLEHLVPGERNEALAGDLLEEFRSGRSVAWYWHQVIAAIAIGCLREIVNHSFLLIFAALWSMLAPAWLLVISGIERYFDLNGRILQMEFPWSTFCDLGLLLSANIVFIWVGIVIYLIPHLWLRKNLRVRPLAHGILASFPALIAVCVVLIVLPKQFLQTGTAYGQLPAPAPTYIISFRGPAKVIRIPQEQTWTALYGDKVASPANDPRSAVFDMRKSALLTRLPFLLCVLWTLWGVTSHQRKRPRRISE